MTLRQRVLRLADNLHRDERGSAELVAFLIITPITVAVVVGFALTAFVRQAVEAPLQPIVSSYTQMYATYGSNTVPDWAGGDIAGEKTTTLMKQALVATGSVQDNNPSNVQVRCGALTADGTIDTGADLVADTLMACEVHATVRFFPGYNLVKDVMPSWIIGKDWYGTATAYVDRGARPNVG